MINKGGTAGVTGHGSGATGVGTGTGSVVHGVMLVTVC